MTYLITGAAGFIGYHVCKRLLDMGKRVNGVDSVNTYYDINLKHARLNNLNNYDKFMFYEGPVQNFIPHSLKSDYICHLGAYAGIPYSLENPKIYEYNNSWGTFHMLERARMWNVKNFVYASSSSVYGESKEESIEDADVDNPLNMYAATKRYNELQARVYSSAYNVKCTGLRFFTVYGEWGRPDMAIYIWTDALYNNKVLKMNGYGKMERNFTFVDDVVDMILETLHIPQEYVIYNIANTNSVDLNYVVTKLEELTGITGKKEYVSIPPGEINKSRANVDKLVSEFGYSPKVDIDEGLERFVQWYKFYYNIKE